MRHRLLVSLLCLLLWPAPGLAHKPSDSYLSLRADGSKLGGQWDIALRDLEHAIGIDADGDGAITWGELEAKHDTIAAYALARLTLRTGTRECPTRAVEQLVDTHSDGAYAVLRFTADCGGNEVHAVDVEYRLFFDLDPTHRGLLKWQAAGLSQAAVLGPDRPRIRLLAGETSPLAQFLAYGREGVWHIWIGIDHILFLLSLLLPAVLVAAGFRWLPAERFAPVFWEVFKVVSAFTVAHSITLSLAALAIIELPARVTETAIALSVLLAALNNVWPLVRGRRWIVAFGFGLIHGFGFASVLSDLGLPQETLLLALVGFNLGVETGQLAIVALFLPLAYALRRTLLYRRVILMGGSAVIALVATAWMVERWFDVRLLA